MEKAFKVILRTPQFKLKAIMEEFLKRNDYKPIAKDGFIYAEGTIPVMLVAHMDTVHKDPVTHICESEDGVIMSPQGIGGDDRCGVYMICRLIAGGYRPHILFTEDEEIGCVGAGKFTESEIKPKVNYIVELDRKGSNDAVYYNCDNPEFEDFVSSFGFKTAYGTCSDISYVAPYIGAAAVNLSCGYYNQHTLHEYIVIPEMENVISRVATMLESPNDKFYEYIEAEHYLGSYGSYYDYDYRKLFLISDYKFCITYNNEVYCDCAYENCDFGFDEKGNIYICSLDWCVATPVGGYDVYLSDENGTHIIITDEIIKAAADYYDILSFDEFEYYAMESVEEEEMEEITEEELINGKV